MDANSEILKAPFPYFGGKSAIVSQVWERFGTVANYVEPFFGSGAMLLGRPDEPGTETVNDKDGFIANFWRALQAEPGKVAKHADWPVNENDLHARHSWLVGQKDSMQTRLEGDPDWFDAKIAGWWVWGMCCWIGSGFCSGIGPWQVQDGQLIHAGAAGMGVNRQLIHAGDAGMGVNRKLIHAGNAGRSVNRKRQRLSGFAETGCNRNVELLNWFGALAARLRRVRVCCGDWSRVCGPSVTFKHGVTAVFLDPPYSKEAGRDEGLYRMDCLKVAHDAREWAIEQGQNPLMRIALCGYEGEHAFPDNWVCMAWNACGGFGSQNSDGNGNSRRERVWFSPHCQGSTQSELFV